MPVSPELRAEGREWPAFGKLGWNSGSSCIEQPGSERRNGCVGSGIFWIQPPRGPRGLLVRPWSVYTVCKRL